MSVNDVNNVGQGKLSIFMSVGFVSAGRECGGQSRVYPSVFLSVRGLVVRKSGCYGFDLGCFLSSSRRCDGGWAMRSRRFGGWV